VFDPERAEGTKECALPFSERGTRAARDGV
jgi:hypothetical protein